MNTLARLASTGVDSLDIADQILITAIVASLQDQKQTFSQKELLTSDFSPTDELSLRAIDRLIKTGLVQSHRASKDSQSVYELKVLNNNQTLRQLIISIKHDYETDEERLKPFIIQVLAAECIEFVISEVEKRNTSIKSDLESPKQLIQLLNNHTCSEVHMLLWQGIQNLGDSDVRILTATQSHSEIIGQIVDNAYQLHERYQQFNTRIKSFNRRSDYRKSAINKILFSQHLGYGQEYFTDVRF